VLKNYADDLHKKKGYTLNAANEIEASCSRVRMPSANITRPASSNTSIRVGIITRCRAIRCARSSTDGEVQRSMGFQNEKGPPGSCPFAV